MILTSADIGVRKPRPEIFQKALNDFGSDPSSTVMVGNNLYTDVKGAKELNIRTIYLEREISNQISIKPDAKVKSLLEVLDTISDWNRP